ncbi:ATP-binding protein [Plantactinospora sp. WMMB334]|uniref:ATP-binding protein n=1 Tax=Plantactinospora sp. WMMB334 TaxID=3404119 RepID=UPI003B92E9AC
MPHWQEQIPTAGTVDLPPDPRALDALGRNHSLETALADLVDNAIDARATDVLIRFVQSGPRLIGLYVVDNGCGIAPDAIDAAMTIGGRREYGSADLGRFGLGLKAASFSQAASLTVLSHAAGHEPVGRRWLISGDRDGFDCDRVPSRFATTELNRPWSIPIDGSGTVIRWDDVHALPGFDDPDRTAEFLGRTIPHLQGHLGLMFHRLLAGNRVRLLIDVEDIDHGTGLPNPVTPLDPFAYPATVPTWPRNLISHVDGVAVTLRCHIWPGRSNRPEYRLPGGAEQRQGLYFYRHDRLLHAGGWEGVHAPDRRLQLARVEVDIDDDMHGLFVMNPEKSRVSAGPGFSQVIGAARAKDGTTIGDYLQAAEDVWINSNRRTTAKRSAVLPPGRGIHPRVSRQIREELPQRDDPPLSIQWRHFAGDHLFEVDRDTSTLWLNQAYRRALLGGRRGGLNDAPLVKALMFLLTEQVFQGAHLGSRDKDNIELWQEILTVAARAEKATFEART